MKQRKLSSILAITLSLELMISPLIPAVHAQSTGSAQQPQGAVNKGFDAVNKSLQVLGTVLGSVNQNQSSGMTAQMQGDMNALTQQQSPQADKYFNSQKLSQIPGLGEYLQLNRINPNQLNCATLRTTLHDAKPEVCRLGITGDSGVNQQAQLNNMFTYYNQYFQVSKLYKNYSSDSNADGQGFGVGCMNNAMNILNGFFKYRMDELDKLTTNLEAMQNQFREASRADLDAIEEAVAVLDGDSAMADKVRSKKPDLFDFKKRFDNPACNSMFAGEALNDRGRSGGLNFINSELKKTLTAKTGKYSGESYSAANTAVVEDINNLADKVAKQLELNFSVLSRDPSAYGKFLSELPDSVSSTSGVNRALTPDLFADVQTKFNESYMKLNEQKSIIMNELSSAGVSGQAAESLLGSTTNSNFDTEVATIENRLKNKCFEDTLSSINRDRLMDKIYDPSASNHANKFSSNFLKDKLNKILDDKDSTLEKKMAELKSLESNTGSRYYLKMENSYEVQEVDDNGNLTTRVVGASSNKTPAVFFSDLIKNCNAQFKANKLSNKMTGASAIQNLKQLNSDYKALAKSQAVDMRKELRKKMIECSSPEEANNTVPGSCTPERFDVSSPGFCAKAAFSCSQNMQACAQQADTFVKEIKTQKTARVNNYKALVQKNKQDIVKIFDSALTRYMRDGEAMRGLFGAGFSSPAGIKREVPEGQRYMAEFQEATSRSPDGKLLLEDPDKYVEMFKQNIALLKKSVKDQQDQILGGESVGRNGGLLADHIKKTKDNYNNVIREADQIANQCIQNHDNAVRAAEAARQEGQKRQSELGEKQREYCTRFNMAAGGNPGPACSSAMEDAFSFGGNGSLERICNETQNSNSTGGADSPEVRAVSICEENGIIISSSTSYEGRASETDPLKKACLGLVECSHTREVTVTPASGSQAATVRAESLCSSDAVKTSRANGVLAAANTGVTVTAADAPAFCNAANNSNDRFSKILSTIQENLANTGAGGYQQ